LNRILKQLLWLSYCLALLPATAWCSPADTLYITDQSIYKVVPSLQYIEDPSDHMGLNEAIARFKSGRYQKSGAINTFNAGITHSAFWFKLVLKNNSHRSRLLFLGIHERVDTLTFYKELGGQVTLVAATGFNYPYSSRPVPNRNFIFKVTVAADSSYTYYLRARNMADYIYMPFALKDADAYMVYETSRYQLLAVYSGLFLFAIIFSLFLFFSLRDKIHLWYAVYVFATLVYLMMEDGVTYEIVLKHFPWFKWALNEDYWWYGCMLLWLYIMQLFTGQNRSNSRFYLATRLTMLVLMIRIFTEFVLTTWGISSNHLWKTVIYYGSDIAFLLAAVLIIAGLIEKIVQRSKAAIVYLFATTFGLLGTLNIYFNYLGLTNINLVEPNGMVIGLTIEIIILSFALTARYNLFRKEKERLLIEVNNHQVTLTEKIVATQEQERKRLAEDLHDDVGATLGALQLHISNLPVEMLRDPAIQAYYAKALSLAGKAAGDIRSISHDLLPKDFTRLGLFQAIANKIEELDQSSPTRFYLITEGDDQQVSDIYAVTVYRIINEVLNNIVKHAEASEATIQVSVVDRQLQIIAEDNGIGMDNVVNKNGIGLQNIQSRINFLKGTLVMDTGSRGTTIIIHIPI
jgi:signal transduction histidine kinase